jgi:15-cis-phytoene synthase/lycopene beta-cyclase
VSYASFLGLFVVLPTLLLGALLRRRFQRADLLPVLVTVAIAFVASFPWDSYAVAHGYWHFNGHQISGAHLGILPIEECAFFALESVLVATIVLPVLNGRRR